MFVTIDASRCEARGYCAKFSPNVFELDDDGYARVIATGDLSGELLEDARSAITACPEQAISLHE